MNSVVVMASRFVERRRKNEIETMLEADLPMRVVALSRNDLDGNEAVVMASSSSFELLLGESIVILITCFCGKLFRNNL